MSEINLTLDPMGEAAAQQPAAPTLTLNPEAEEKKEAPVVDLDEQLLSEAEKKVVDEFSKKIDIRDSNQVLQYGVAAQKNVAAFSTNALNKVSTRDLGEVGDALSSLVVQLKNNTPGEQKKTGFFRRSKVKLDEMRAQYAKAEANVDQVTKILEQHQVNLMKDVAMLDQMYELNQQYYKELTMYILAGKKKIKERKEDAAEAALERKIIDTVVENAKVNVPQCMIDEETEEMVNEFAYRLMYQGMNIDDYYKYTGQTEQQLKETYKEPAMRTVKTRLVLEQVIKAAGIEVTAEDEEAVYADLAAKQNKPVEEIKKDFNEHYASYIKNEALNKKLMAYLKDNNTIK